MCQKRTLGALFAHDPSFVNEIIFTLLSYVGLGLSPYIEPSLKNRWLVSSQNRNPENHRIHNSNGNSAIKLHTYLKEIPIPKS